MNRCGFVHMSTYDMADNAISALNGTEFRGQHLVVEAGKSKDRPITMSRGGGGRGASMRGMGGRGSSMHGGRNNEESGMSGGMGRGRGNFHQRGGNRGRGNMMHNDMSSGRGGNFNGRNNRGGGAVGGGGGFSNDNASGPMRSPNFKKNRTAPYPQGGNFNNQDYQDTAQFGATPAPQKYGGHSRGGSNFNHRSSNSNNYVTQTPEVIGNNYQSFPDPEEPYQNTNMYSQNVGRGGGSAGGAGTGMSKFGRGRPNNGQDRRGFALPSHQQQGAPNQQHFGSEIPNNEINNFSPSYPPNTEVPSMRGGGGGRGSFRGNRGSFQSDRGKFNNSRGGYNEGRNGFARDQNRETFKSQNSEYQGTYNGGRTGGYMSDRGSNQFKRGGGSGQFNMQNNYQTEFPPLRGGGSAGFRGGRGSSAGHIQRQSTVPNRRFN